MILKKDREEVLIGNNGSYHTIIWKDNKIVSNQKKDFCTEEDLKGLKSEEETDELGFMPPTEKARRVLNWLFLHGSCLIIEEKDTVVPNGLGGYTIYLDSK